MADDQSSRPEIYNSTPRLLRHLQKEGAQSEKQLEASLGDVDQIGPTEIADWVEWAQRDGLIESTGGGRWNITDKGQRNIGPPSASA